jgi:predicted Zn-dependent protease
MRETVQEMIQTERDELHLMVAIPTEQADREREHLIQKQTGEPTKARCERMAYEEEFLRQRPQNAEQYLLKLLKEKEGDPALMWPLAQFYLRQGNLEKAEQYMRDSLSFDVENQETMFSYSCLLLQLNRTGEAIIMLKYLEAQGYRMKVAVQLFLAHAYKIQGDAMMCDKYKAQAWIASFREAEEPQIPALGESKDNAPKSSTSMMKFIAAQQQAASVQENQSQEGAASYEIPS